MAYLQIDHVGISFSRGGVTTEVLRDVNLRIEPGEYVSIIGHSGCGKSTLLNIVAGLLRASLGGVLLEGREVERARPRPGGGVPEPFPPALADRAARMSGSPSTRCSAHGNRAPSGANGSSTISSLVRMNAAADKRPSEISGGMKQRVGIARALAMEPKVLLLDEPFGALDALTRAHLQDQVMEIHARLGNTVLMITHDVDEAVLLSDRIVMMTNGPGATHRRDPQGPPAAAARSASTLVDDPTYNHAARPPCCEFLYARHAAPALAA